MGVGSARCCCGGINSGLRRGAGGRLEGGFDLGGGAWSSLEGEGTGGVEEVCCESSTTPAKVDVWDAGRLMGKVEVPD